MKEAIESDFPLPDKQVAKKFTDLLSKMEIGNSFEIPESVSVQQMRVFASRYGREHGCKFSVIQVTKKPPTFRVWRLQP